MSATRRLDHTSFFYHQPSWNEITGCLSNKDKLQLLHISKKLRDIIFKAIFISTTPYCQKPKDENHDYVHQDFIRKLMHFHQKILPNAPPHLELVVPNLSLTALTRLRLSDRIKELPVTPINSALHEKIKLALAYMLDHIHKAESLTTLVLRCHNIPETQLLRFLEEEVTPKLNQVTLYYSENINRAILQALSNRTITHLTINGESYKSNEHRYAGPHLGSMMGIGIYPPSFSTLPFSIEDFTGFSSLTTLHLKNIKEITDQDAHHIGKDLSQLTTLDINNVPLSLHGCRSLFAKTPSLTHLSLQQLHKFNDDCVLAIQDQLTRLKNLKISNCCRIHAFGMTALMPSQLEELYINNIRSFDDKVACVVGSSFNKLHTLTICHLPLSNEGMCHLFPPSLTNLSCINQKFAQVALKHLMFATPQLKKLKIKEKELMLEERDVEYFMQMPRLTHLYIDYATAHCWNKRNLRMLSNKWSQFPMGTAELTISSYGKNLLLNLFPRPLKNEAPDEECKQSSDRPLENRGNSPCCQIS